MLEKLLFHPPLSEESPGWGVDGHIEIYTRDSDYFSENKENADYPVYGGSNIYQFIYNSTFFDLTKPGYWSVDEDIDPDHSAKRRVREKNLRVLKNEIYENFGGEKTNKSKKAFVNDLLRDERGEELHTDDVKLDCTEYRIVYRNITNSTNERTFIATVIPKGIICYHALTTIRPYEIDIQQGHLTKSSLQTAYVPKYSDSAQFVLSGLLNSLPFDYFMRTKIDTNVARYKLEGAPMPVLTDGDDWFHYIADRAARLNCYGEAFAEMRERLGGIEPATEEGERRRLQAEIDAAAFHAYGLDREDTAFVLDDFHRVENPRLMDEAYFEMVLEKYDELAEEGVKE